MIPEEKLHTFLKTLPFAAHVRDITTGKYILANRIHAKNHDFSDVKPVTNITYTELYHYRRQKLSTLQGSLLLEDKYKAFIDKVNVQADNSQKPLSFKSCTLFPTGFIYIGALKKIPLTGNHQKTVAILTFSEEITHHLDLLDLYNLYRKHYPVHQAVTQFLNYLGIASYFHQDPTNQELITLLVLRRSSISKYAARQLGISYRTVEEYKSRLRSKLKTINLNGLLVLLRVHLEKPIELISNISQNNFI